MGKTITPTSINSQIWEKASLKKADPAETEFEKRTTENAIEANKKKKFRSNYTQWDKAVDSTKAQKDAAAEDEFKSKSKKFLKPIQTNN